MAEIETRDNVYQSTIRGMRSVGDNSHASVRFSTPTSVKVCCVTQYPTVEKMRVVLRKWLDTHTQEKLQHSVCFGLCKSIEGV